MPKEPATPKKLLSDLARSTKMAVIGLGSALFAGLTVYGEYHLGSS